MAKVVLQWVVEKLVRANDLMLKPVWVPVGRGAEMLQD